MSLLLLAVVFVFFVSGSGLRRLARPKEPGFYEMSLNNNGLEYKRLYLENILSNDLNLTYLPGNNKEITAFDFRLLSDSSQTKYVLNSGSCGDTYALGVTDAVGVAAYLNTIDSPQKINKVVSVAYEVACEGCRDFKGERVCQQGCFGGLPDLVFEYIMERGFVTRDCIPDHQSECPTVCEDGSEIQFHEHDGLSVTSAYNVEPSLLRSLLTSSGPCVAEMYVHSNFLQYTGGVYKRPPGSQAEESFMNHVVVIYGFGVEDGQAYWIGKNLWGGFWGEQGYFKIEMGRNDSGIEELFLCPNNNAGKGVYATVPLPPQPEWCFDVSGPCPPPSSSTGRKARWWIVAVSVVGAVVVAVIAVAIAVVMWRRRRGRRGLGEGEGERRQAVGNEASDAQSGVGGYRPSELLGEEQSVEETSAVSEL